MLNPALTAFVSQIRNELVCAQVLLRRRECGFELRHVDDARRGLDELRPLKLRDLRSLAQFTAGGEFRPLKSAPNLQTGWRLAVQTDLELETALRHLYPGALADWHAAQSATPPVTEYRGFTERQTGMYRITQKLNDAQAAETIRACCHKDFCLKRRLWSVRGLELDSADEKSLIPCLEPCALLLEFARRAMRLEQEAKLGLELPPGDVRTLAGALERALAHPAPEVLEADFSAPLNPRRLRRLLGKLERDLKSAVAAPPDSSEPAESL